MTLSLICSFYVYSLPLKFLLMLVCILTHIKVAGLCFLYLDSFFTIALISTFYFVVDVFSTNFGVADMSLISYSVVLYVVFSLLCSPFSCCYSTYFSVSVFCFFPWFLFSTSLTIWKDDSSCASYRYLCDQTISWIFVVFFLFLFVAISIIFYDISVYVYSMDLVLFSSFMEECSTYIFLSLCLIPPCNLPLFCNNIFLISFIYVTI